MGHVGSGGPGQGGSSSSTGSCAQVER
jgi:hypothetical protein